MKKGLVMLIVALTVVVGCRLTGQYIGKAMADHQVRAQQQIRLLSQ